MRWWVNVWWIRWWWGQDCAFISMNYYSCCLQILTQQYWGRRFDNLRLDLWQWSSSRSVIAVPPWVTHIRQPIYFFCCLGIKIRSCWAILVFVFWFSTSATDFLFTWPSSESWSKCFSLRASWFLNHYQWSYVVRLLLVPNSFPIPCAIFVNEVSVIFVWDGATELPSW